MKTDLRPMPSPSGRNSEGLFLRTVQLTRDELQTALALDEALEAEGEGGEARPRLNGKAMALIMKFLTEQGVPAEQISELHLKLKGGVDDSVRARDDDGDFLDRDPNDDMPETGVRGGFRNRQPVDVGRSGNPAMDAALRRRLAQDRRLSSSIAEVERMFPDCARF